MAKTRGKDKETVEELEARAEREEAALKRLKKLAKEREALLDEGEDGDGLDPEALPGEDRIRAIMGELGGQGSFDVFRIEGGKQVKCGSYDLELYPQALEGVVRQKGGGEYMVVLRNADGTLAGRVSRTFDPSTYAPAAAPSTPSIGAGGDFMSLLALMEKRDEARRADEERRDRLHREELEKIRAASEKRADAFNVLMLETVKSGQGSLSKTIVELSPLLTPLLKHVFADKKSPIEELLDLKELMGELKSDSAADASPLNAILSSVASALKPAISSRAPHVPAPALASPAAPPSVSSPGAGPVPPSKLSLLAYASGISEAISSGASPELAAQYVWTSALERGEDELLRKNISLGDWEGLKSSSAFLTGHAVWVDTFRAKLEERATAPLVEPTPVPEPEPSPLKEPAA